CLRDEKLIASLFLKPSLGELGVSAVNLLGRRPGTERSHGYELTIANVIIAIAPADRVARKTDQPDAESDRVPHGDETQLFPERIVFQAPNADQPGHGKAQPQVRAEIAE